MLLGRAVLCALAMGLAQPAAAQEIPVDLELVLGVDVSGSVDEREYSLQPASATAREP